MIHNGTLVQDAPPCRAELKGERHLCEGSHCELENVWKGFLKITFLKVEILIEI